MGAERVRTLDICNDRRKLMMTSVGMPMDGDDVWQRVQQCIPQPQYVVVRIRLLLRNGVSLLHMEVTHPFLLHMEVTHPFLLHMEVTLADVEQSLKLHDNPWRQRTLRRWKWVGGSG